ncbi:MAG: hypothetical protein HYU36_04990 [Planctomycetes bacterium]|nr:hypothetical protein [Planctomycetota bacterium]
MISTWHATHPGDYDPVERWTPEARYPHAQQLVRDGRLRVYPLITCRYPFREAHRAMEMRTSRDGAVTCVLDFES